MDLSALGGCHQQIHQVPRRSSARSEHFSKVKFSGFFIVPAVDSMFCLGMLALILTLPWNPSSAYAWNFSNDGIPSPPIVMGLGAPPATPPALPSDGPIAARIEVPPSPSLAPTSTPLPSGSPPPISMANPPSPSTGAPAPTLTAKKGKRLSWWAIVGIMALPAFVVGICVLCCLLCRRRVSRCPLRIFISHAPGSHNLPMLLTERMKSLLKSRVKIFFDPESSRLGLSFATTIFKELARFDVGIVVITEEYFDSKWPMIELIAFTEAQRNDPRNRICIIPVFYDLSPDELKVHLNEGTWEESWQEMARGAHPIEVEKCREAVKWLCSGRRIRNISHGIGAFDYLYTDTVCKEVDKIFREERSFSSNLRRAKTTVSERVTQMPLTGTEKRRRRAKQRAEKENGLMTYINKRLQLLFALSGLLNILLSVILDNSFNDQPVRFTAFAILAPLTIFLGFLASGWFPWIPLRFIASIKGRGFLQQVVPCSPWHDNVVTDYCGGVCLLEPLENARGTTVFELPMSVQNFLHGDRISPQGTTATATTHSKFDPEIQDFQVATSVQEGHDLQRLTTGSEMLDFAPFSGTLERTHSEMATGPVSSPNLQETPSSVGDIIVDIGRSFMFHILDDERAPMFEFDGPEINGFPLTVQAFKNTSTEDHTFDLSCTFRNKRTKRMYLTTARLENLVCNMCKWVKHPYPIVVDESSDILHCMAIEDILWEFTKTVSTFKSVFVVHRFLAGWGQMGFLIIWSFASISLLSSLIPLTSDKKSYYYLFFLLVLVPYPFALKKANALTFYFIKSLFCPICVRIFGFNRLYKSKSSFRWCNEFRKKRIVNPTHFWIDEEYANTCPDADNCLDVCGFLELPDSPPKGQSFTVSCQGWPAGVPAICKKQHDYILRVKFDSVELIGGVDCYTNVRLSFLEDDYLLGEKTHTAIEVQRVHLVEKLFHCFSNPSFGGYVEKIGRTGYCSTTFVAHCPRFIDFCQTVLNCKNPVPKLLVASRMPGSKFVVGVPFWSSEL